MTAVMAGVSLILVGWVEKGTGWVATLQGIWSSLLVSVIMAWSAAYWKNMPFTGVVPVILLALAIWTVSVPGKAERVGCVLFWPLVLLLGAVLLSGGSEIKGEYLYPDWKEPNLGLMAVLLLPGVQMRKRKRGTAEGLAFLAVAVSAVTTGVLSQKVASEAGSGIYEMSRSLSLLGMAERFESLVAAAMTLGFYGVTGYLMEKEERKGLAIWVNAAIAVVIYLAEIRIPQWLMALGTVIVWIILPHLYAGKINEKNQKKGIDKI